MSLPKDDERKIMLELGLLANESYNAEFYMHKALDNEETYGESREKAVEQANAKSLKLGREIEPDFTPENLKKLGAKTVFKNVPYVKITRRGAKDCKSYAATEQHKKQFPEAWAKFEAENNEDIRKERDNLRTETSGRVNSSQGGDWQGGVNYTPSNYTITFG